MQVRLLAAESGTNKSIIDVLAYAPSLGIPLQVTFGERGFEIFLWVGTDKVREDVMEEPPQQDG
jgi:hypothetical protein